MFNPRCGRIGFNPGTSRVNGVPWYYYEAKKSPGPFQRWNKDGGRRRKEEEDLSVRSSKNLDTPRDIVLHP